MRKRLWVAFCLAGLWPVTALAQEAREPAPGPARVPQETSNEALQQQVTELWQGFRMLQQEVASLREQVRGPEPAPAVGGSGLGGEASMTEQSGGMNGSGVSVSRNPGQAGQATGGGGQAGGGARPAERAPGDEVIVGIVRDISGGRMLLADPMGRIFELDVNEQTRVIGHGGVFAPTQVLEAGTPVRAVAEGGEERGLARDIYILNASPTPAR